MSNINMGNEGGGVFSGLFGILVMISCVLVLTDAAALVFSFWTILVVGALALYVILIPVRIFLSGMESLNDSFRR
jgi:hypothetical protein